MIKQWGSKLRKKQTNRPTNHAEVHEDKKVNINTTMLTSTLSYIGVVDHTLQLLQVKYYQVFGLKFEDIKGLLNIRGGNHESDMRYISDSDSKYPAACRQHPD